MTVNLQFPTDLADFTFQLFNTPQQLQSQCALWLVLSEAGAGRHQAAQQRHYQQPGNTGSGHGCVPISK